VFKLFKLLIMTVLILSLLLNVTACQGPTTTVTQTVTSSTATTTTTATLPPVTTTSASTSTKPPETTTTVTPVTTTTPAGPELPTLVSLSADISGADLQGVEFAQLTGVFLFNDKENPGYYYIDLLSDNDSFGPQTVEWYRTTKQVTLVWKVWAGHDAYYRLKNNEPVSKVFKTRITYSPFISLSIPGAAPTDMERALADRINVERNSRHLPVLTWDNDLYKQALQRLYVFGLEGIITAPQAGQLETAYVSTGGVNEDAISVYQSWIVNEKYLAVLTNPDIKYFAVRSDTYSNHKFFVIGLYK
jgi:hypothetical protein